MKCKICGEDYPSKINFKTYDICHGCWQKLSKEERQNPEKLTPKDSATGKTISTTYHFRTLIGYGKFISGFGWIFLILGICAILGGLVGALTEEGGNREILFTVAAGGISASIVGLSLVIFGQLISCFVSIERNTRVVFEILKTKEGL